MTAEQNKKVKLVPSAHTDIIGPRNTRKPNGALEFIKDLLTGFTALLLFLFIIFICVPLAMIALKIGVVIAIPLLYFGTFIVCLALLGRLIRVLVMKK